MEKSAIREGRQICQDTKQLAMLNRIGVMLQSQSSNRSALELTFDITLLCSGS